MKICSLLPSGTEILFALGLGDRVVGVTDMCDYPPEARTKTVVSRSLIDTSTTSSAEVDRKMQEFIKAGQNPSVLDTEFLVRLNPDLILTQDVCFICDLDANEVFKALPLLRRQPAVLVLSPRMLSDILASISAVGEATGARAKATELVDRLQHRIHLVETKAAVATERRRVLSLEGVDPLVCGGHWLPEMKGLAGGKDGLFSPACAARRLMWETVSAYAPDVLIITPCSSGLGRSLKELPWLARQYRWWDLPAVRAGEVYVIDHVYFSRPGPRIVKGLEILAQILHPDLFVGMIPPGSVLKLDTLASRGCLPEELAQYFYPYPESQSVAWPCLGSNSIALA